MVEADAVLEVAYRVLGVAAMISLQFQGLSVPVGDEAVIAVGGEEGQLGTGRRWIRGKRSSDVRAAAKKQALWARMRAWRSA